MKRWVMILAGVCVMKLRPQEFVKIEAPSTPHLHGKVCQYLRPAGRDGSYVRVGTETLVVSTACLKPVEKRND